MDRVRVIAAGGLEISGPARLQLSPAQLARRRHVLDAGKDGVAEVPGGRRVGFKAGEEFGIAPGWKFGPGQVEPVAAERPKRAAKS